MPSGIPPTARVATARLADGLRDARARSLELIADLSDAQLIGPRLPTVNPLLWEIGHVAWFHEHFILQRAHGAAPLDPRAHTLYDSIAIAHERRWDLPLPSRAATLDYLRRVEDALLERLRGEVADALDSYLYQFTTFHEDMHGEAFTWARQTLAYPAPRLASAARAPDDADAGALPGDAEIPGGEFLLGAPGDAPFVFDNEKWCHRIDLAPFRIARAPVTNEAYAAFVAEGGYARRALWSESGWHWRERAGAQHPMYWTPDGEGGFGVRRFDEVAALAPQQPVIHVNWYEASAWCRWAARRLPREVEWEAAALGMPDAGGTHLAEGKRRYPWGGDGPDPARANLDASASGCVDVAALPAGDSAFGCRQMLGNVWEWCADAFTPYPGFVPDAYQEYSQPLFGHTRVLRGGAWPSRSRLLTGLYRNYFEPERRDVFAGFRSCAQ